MEQLSAEPQIATIRIQYRQTADSPLVDLGVVPVTPDWLLIRKEHPETKEE